MKKILFLSLIYCAVISTSVNAQPAPEQVSLLEQMKEKFKLPMIEKTGLTEIQVDKVIEINFEIRLQSVTTLQGLSDSERSKKLAELKAEKEKRYSAIPLTAEQIKAVYAFYEDMSKNTTPPKREN